MSAPPAAVEIPLPESFGLDAAQFLASALRAADALAPVRIDASAVAVMSTPGVLTIAAAVRSRAVGAPAITVASPTAAFMDAFSDLGLFGDLMKLEFAT